MYYSDTRTWSWFRTLLIDPLHHNSAEQRHISYSRTADEGPDIGRQHEDDVVVKSMIFRDAAGLYGHRYGQQLHIEQRPAQYLPHISDTWNCCRKRGQASRTFTAESLPSSDFLLLLLLSGRLGTASALLPPCGDDHLNKLCLPNLYLSIISPWSAFTQQWRRWRSVNVSLFPYLF